jgi:hypothetical protein
MLSKHIIDGNDKKGGGETGEYTIAFWALYSKTT